MSFIAFEMETLTPAFLAGADQDVVDLRAASFRGLLRWWWRAGWVGSDTDQLRQAEGALFGSTDLGLKSTLRITTKTKEIKVIPAGTRAPQSGVTYEYVRNGRRGTTDVLPYLAYGPVRLLSREEKQRAERERDPKFFDSRQGHPKGGALFLRPAIAPGTRFELKLAWRDGTLTGDQVVQLIRATAALVTLGGIGSRSRKGFGALSGKILEFREESRKDVAEIWDAAVQGLMNSGEPLTGPIPKYPTLKHRVVHLGQPKTCWQHALGQAGLTFKEKRPKNEFRWIAGDARPRRASSVLLSVVKNQSGYQGVISLLPCLKEGLGGEEQMQQFYRQFQDWRL